MMLWTAGRQAGKGKYMAKTRIQKVLSENGILSRRKAEEYVAQGRITVNGRRAETGAAVDPEKDIITIDGIRLELSSRVRKVYLLLNKPRGYVTTLSDELGRRCVAELVEDAPERVYPVGRLDKDSEGALILTNDGDFANLIMHPSHHISKTYRVTVRPSVSEDQLVRLSSGIEIDGRTTAPAQVDVIEKRPDRTIIQMVIHEGRNRQVRKMCEAVGLEVARLKRSSVGPIRLGMLPPGKWRELTPQEVRAVRGAVKGQEIQAVPPKGEKKNFGRDPVKKKSTHPGRKENDFTFRKGRQLHDLGEVPIGRGQKKPSRKNALRSGGQKYK